MQHSGIPRTRSGSRFRRATVAAAMVATAVAGLPAQTAGAAEPGDAPTMRAIDPQEWVNPDDMVWDDYKPVPGTDWNDPSRKGSVDQFKAALVLLDFPDEKFNVTLPAHSTVFGNPQALAHDVPEDQVAQFYEDFLNKPNELNGGHTIHEYWMEDSNGRYGVDMDAFGPYTLPEKSHEYGLENSMNGGSAQPHCPAGDTCNQNLRNHGLPLWRSAVGAAVAAGYDHVFIVTAGQDESGVWQEFGSMLWERKEDVTDDFGPPDPNLPNWAQSRYMWSSWKAASAHWPNAQSSGGQPSSTQAESSGLGTYTHEMSHLLGIADNYNNPYQTPYLVRDYTGIWGMLSRGQFNGPGGPHTRWMIPPTQGGAMGAQHILRDKIDIGLIDEDQVARLSREALDDTGIAVVKVKARAAQGNPGSGVINGVNVAMDVDHQPGCWLEDGPDCPRLNTRDRSGNVVLGPGYNNYTVEVAQRIGTDSFLSDDGVLLNMTKNQDRIPFAWTIDAHPEDLNLVNFYHADGTPEMITMGDYRQLADGLFHAGTNSGSEYEYVDEHNRLHFYVLDVESDADGVLSYTVAVRSLDGSGPQARGVATTSGTMTSTTTAEVMDVVRRVHADGATSNRTDQKLALTLNQIRVREAKGQFKQAVSAMEYLLQVVEEEVSDASAKQSLLDAAYAKNAELGGRGAVSCTFPLTNTGAAGVSAGHPEDATAWLANDVYRLSVSAAGNGWNAELPNALATAKAGESVDVPVHVTRTGTAAKSGSVTLTAVSESDPTKTATATCAVAVNPDALT
jgi:M6 family metalloprotease-like protein